jgi:hypothetical protein
VPDCPTGDRAAAQRVARRRKRQRSPLSLSRLAKCWVCDRTVP